MSRNQSRDTSGLKPHHAHQRAAAPNDTHDMMSPTRAHNAPAPKTKHRPSAAEIRAARSPAVEHANQEDQRVEETPHIDVMLSALAERQPPPSEAEIEVLASNMATHLITCEECQYTLSAIIQRLADQSGEDSAERERGMRLLERFNAVLAKARARNRLGAYVLLCSMEGEPAAAAKYPDVAEHLATCERCRADVDTRVQQRKAQLKAQEHADSP